MTPDLRISQIEITDLFGTRSVRFSPKTYTELCGSNGTGKSSILRAIMVLFDGGHDPAWIRKGAKRGIVKIIITDSQGALFVTATKTVTPKSCTLEVLNEKGVAIPGPQTFINSLGKSWAVDPGKLLTIDATKASGRKELVATLLQLMPLSFERADLVTACEKLEHEFMAKNAAPGAKVQPIYSDSLAVASDILPPPYEQLTLEKINKLRKDVEEFRRRTGVELRDQQGVITTLQGSLPADVDGADWPATLSDERKRLQSLLACETTDRAKTEKAANIFREGCLEECAAQERAAREEFQVKLAAIEKVKQQAVQDSAAAEKEALDAIAARYRPQADALTVDIAKLEARVAAEQRAEGVKRELETYLRKSEATEQKRDQYTRVLEAIDCAKKAKLDSLPVPGLVVEGDQPYIDGVEWQNVNTARLTDVAVAICASQAGALPFMIVDDAEHLDEAHRLSLRRSAAEFGFQFLAARVLNGPNGEEVPLRIEYVSDIGPQPDGTLALRAPEATN